MNGKVSLLRIMKKIYPKSERSGMTMTVAELIAELQKYDDSLPVIATWRCLAAGFRSENFAVYKEDGRKELLIDVENYG